MATEHLEQKALFNWANLQEKRYPELRNMFAIPNGAKLPYTNFVNKNGLKKSWSPKRKQLTDEGLKPGVPDIFLAYANKTYHGLFIEMKAGKNKASDKQRQWLSRLNYQGYLAVLCYSFEEAQKLILKYIKNEL